MKYAREFYYRTSLGKIGSTLREKGGLRKNQGPALFSVIRALFTRFLDKQSYNQRAQRLSSQL
jgi:hypothetical protein